MGLIASRSPVKEHTDAKAYEVNDRRPAQNGHVLGDAPFLPPKNESKYYGIQQVGERRVECPESLVSTRSGSLRVEADVRLCDFLRERGEGLLEGRWGAVIALI